MLRRSDTRSGFLKIFAPPRPEGLELSVGKQTLAAGEGGDGEAFNP